MNLWKVCFKGSIETCLLLEGLNLKEIRTKALEVARKEGLTLYKIEEVFVSRRKKQKEPKPKKVSN